MMYVVTTHIYYFTPVIGIIISSVSAS